MLPLIRKKPNENGLLLIEYFYILYWWRGRWLISWNVSQTFWWTTSHGFSSDLHFPEHLAEKRGERGRKLYVFSVKGRLDQFPRRSKSRNSAKTLVLLVLEKPYVVQLIQQKESFRQHLNHFLVYLSSLESNAVQDRFISPIPLDLVLKPIRSLNWLT